MDINLIAPFTSHTSYGLVALNILKELSRLGHSVSAFPIGGMDVQTQEEADILNQSLNNAKFFNYEADCVRLFHQFSLDMFVGRGRKIGFPIFELDEFAPQELHHLNYCDSLIVPSKWAKKVCEQNGVSCRIDVVPLGVDTTVFMPIDEPRQHKPTRFLNIGKAELRKGHDVILEAFEQAFTPLDDVELIMCWENVVQPKASEEWKRLYSSSKLADKIKFVPRLNNQLGLVNLINQCDAGIFPSRAEGWNLPLLEMMACGKPVVATNYSAHTEFCRPENCYLIDIANVESAYDGHWFNGEYGNWASLEHNEKNKLVHYMTEIYSLTQQTPEKFVYNEEGVATASHFSWKQSAIKLVEALEV